MVIEMLLNNDLQLFFCSNNFKLSKGNKCNYVYYWIEKKSKLESFYLNKISIKYEFSKYVFVMFKMKNLINRMWCNILSQQVGWLDGIGVCFHSKNQRIKLHEWCYVWSTMVCWPNIPLWDS